MLLEYLIRGGWLVWVIFLALFVCLSICLERLLYFLGSYTPFPNLKKLPKVNYRKSQISVEEIFSAAGTETSASWLAFLPFKSFRLEHSPYYRIALVYQEHIHSSVSSRVAALKRNGEEIIAELERRITSLQVIATITPLLGLLGTILGMMKAFQAMEDSGGVVSIDQLAGGIWVAMLTTAFGLIVSIPAHIMHSFFRSIIDTRTRQMNAVIQYIEEHCS